MIVVASLWLSLALGVSLPMTLDDLEPLLAQNRIVTFTTYRRDGRPQMSLVTVGRFKSRQREVCQFDA